MQDGEFCPSDGHFAECGNRGVLEITEADAVFTAAMKLTIDDRLRLIDELAATVPDDRRSGYWKRRSK
jgi:hypothetical protein